MSWRDQKWLEPFLPNYLKPLRDPRVDSEHTREFIDGAEEFISDIAALSELPRLNKTFKRNIKGYLFKVKIKIKKISLELVDTKKSSADIKKKVYITILRNRNKTENGIGKCIDSTIYYHVDNRTIVRNVRRHPLFQNIFIKLHVLDMSLDNQNTGSTKASPLPTTANNKNLEIRSQSNPKDEHSLENKLNSIIKQYSSLDSLIYTKLAELSTVFKENLDEIYLLDIEEKHHLKRMFNHDLPNLLETYASLSAEQQKEAYDEVISSLNTMRNYLKNQMNQLNSTRMDRMNQLLKLNQLRYQQLQNTKEKEEDI